MTIAEICAALNAEIQNEAQADKEISSAVAGDLLSFIMGTAEEGVAWVTIQTHLNVAAVAVLKNVPLLLIASGRKAAPDLVERCREENICVASCPETIFGICAKLAELGLKG